MALRIFHGKAHYEVKNGWPTDETARNEDNYSVSYEGCVLRLMERNGYDDSDFYAFVWDAVEGRVIEREYATTRGWTYFNSAVVDATPETFEAVKAYATMLAASQVASKIAADEATAHKGDLVEVVGGRKYLGRKGRVFWRGEDKYNSSRWAVAYRVGFETEEGDKVFVPEEQVKVTDFTHRYDDRDAQIARWTADHVRALLATWGVPQ